MNDNESKKAPEALADDALENVSGGMDLAALCGCICEDCGLADVESVHHYEHILGPGESCGITLCTTHAAQRRQRGEVLQSRFW